MSVPLYRYNPEMPKPCPPNDAEPAGQIFKAVASVPATAADFMSDIETGKPGAKPSRCKNWGCSVWQTEAAALHGREVYAHFRESFIVCAQLAPTDGEVLTTPSKKQPQHSTFWKVHDLDVSSKFTVAMRPELLTGGDPFQSEAS